MAAAVTEGCTVCAREMALPAAASACQALRSNRGMASARTPSRTTTITRVTSGEGCTEPPGPGEGTRLGTEGMRGARHRGRIEASRGGNTSSSGSAQLGDRDLGVTPS